MKSRAKPFNGLLHGVNTWREMNGQIRSDSREVTASDLKIWIVVRPRERFLLKRILLAADPEPSSHNNQAIWLVTGTALPLHIIIDGLAVFSLSTYVRIIYSISDLRFSPFATRISLIYIRLKGHPSLGRSEEVKLRPYTASAFAGVRATHSSEHSLNLSTCSLKLQMLLWFWISLSL